MYFFVYRFIVKQTREAVLDSKFLVVAAKLGRVQAQKLQTHLVKFDPDVFAEKLVWMLYLLAMI